jgi:hypothetical protein
VAYFVKALANYGLPSRSLSEGWSGREDLNLLPPELHSKTPVFRKTYNLLKLRRFSLNPDYQLAYAEIGNSNL